MLTSSKIRSILFSSFLSISLLTHSPALASSLAGLKEVKVVKNSSPQKLTTAGNTKSTQGSLSAGAIAGIVVVSLAVVGGGVGAVVYLTQPESVDPIISEVPSAAPMAPLVTEAPTNYLENYTPTNCTRPMIEEAEAFITLVYDDAHGTIYPFVPDLMQLSNMTGDVMVVSNLVGAEGYLSKEQLDDMVARGWCVGGHSRSHENLELLNTTGLEYEITGNQEDLIAMGYDPVCFAFPYGAYSPEALAIANRDFVFVRVFHDEGVNVWPYNDAKLKSIKVEYNTSMVELKARIDEVVKNKEWGVMVLHEVNPEGSDYKWGSKPEFIKELVDYVACSGAAVVNFKDMANRGVINLLENSDFSEPLASNVTVSNSSLVRRDSQGHGKAPEGNYSLELIGSPDKETHFIFPKISVEPEGKYKISAYVNNINLTGNVNFRVDEYDKDDLWVESQNFLGFVGTDGVTVHVSDYNVSSPLVKKAELKVYLNEGAEGSAFVDRVRWSYKR